MCSVIQSDVPGNSIDKDMHYEHIGQMGAGKYLRENCYHRIEYSAPNQLALFMWRRPLNSTILVASTHGGPVRMSDGTSTQVVA